MHVFRLNLFILAFFFVITFPAYSALLHPGMLTSHDGEGHIIRMFEFNKAIEDGHFPVRWAKRLNWGLGYPYFNFNYPLTYYSTYLMHILGLDPLTSFKAILLLSFPLSGFFAFLWLKQHFSLIASLSGALIYTLMPYHFLNVYVRGNIAETLALTLVPLGLLAINRLYKTPGIKSTVLLAFCLSSIILTHNITALLFLPIINVYGLLLGFNKRFLKYLLSTFLLTILLTSFFWFPVLLTKQIITIDKTFPLYYKKHFLDIKDLIYSPWGYGGSKTGPGQMSPQVGLLHLLVLAVSLFTVFKIKVQKKIAVFFLGLSFAVFLMMLPVGKPVWDLLVPLQYIQFPWRLLAVLALTVSFLASVILTVISKKKIVQLVMIILIAGSLLFLNRNHWRANQYYDLPQYWFFDQPYGSTTTVDGEHTPKWQADNQPNEPSRFELVSGQAKISSLVWKTNKHIFEIEAQSESVVLDRTVYFPGWTVFIDGRRVTNIDQTQPGIKGLIGFEVPPGNHLIEVRLLEPWPYKIADSISLIVLIVLIMLLAMPNRYLTPQSLPFLKQYFPKPREY